MADSRQLAGLIGPTMVAIGFTEWINFGIFAHQIAPVVYLDGAIMFVTGLALIRAHNRWGWNWPTLITITAWVLALGGLYRMIAPEAPQASANVTNAVMFAGMIAAGLFLTYKGYKPENGR